MKDKLSVAVIGCGQIADLHITEIQKIPEARLVAVCDANEIMAEQAAVRFAVPRYYTNFEQLLQSHQPDVVHITTPPQSHLALGKAAISHGAHAYIEKPFTVNAEEAQELVDFARKNKREACIGHNFSFDAAALRAKELVRQGVMGDVRHVDSVYTYNLRGSFGKILFEKPKHWIHALPGKLFQNVISHAVYNVTDYITDPEPKLRAVGFKLRSQRFGDRRDEFNDELRVLIQGDKCTGHILFSSHIQPSMHWMRLYGTKASLSVNFNARSVTFDPSTTLPGVFGRVALPFKTATAELGNGFRNIRRFIQSDLQFNDGMNRLFRAFYQAILAGQPSPIPMHEAVRVTRILDDIFRQAQ